MSESSQRVHAQVKFTRNPRGQAPHPDQIVVFPSINNSLPQYLPGQRVRVDTFPKTKIFYVL